MFSTGTSGFRFLVLWIFFLPLFYGAPEASGAQAHLKKSVDGVVPGRYLDRIEPFLGTYLGFFNTGLTPDPLDDLNFSPCGGADEDPCRNKEGVWLPHKAPLVNIIFRLRVAQDQRLVGEFFDTPESLIKNEPMDLLGRYCESEVGNLVGMKIKRNRDKSSKFEAHFHIIRGRCLNNFSKTKNNDLVVKLTLEPGQDTAKSLELSLIGRIISQNYLYVKEWGENYRVKVNHRDHPERRSLYNPDLEFCPVDEKGQIIGDSTNCFKRTKKVKKAILPFGLGPGGLGLGVTGLWYTKTEPKVLVKKRAPKLLYHKGYFQRVNPAKVLE